MTAEALGVSVAPSFFHTCVAAGKTAKMEDVEKFKVQKTTVNSSLVNSSRRLIEPPLVDPICEMMLFASDNRVSWLFLPLSTESRSGSIKRSLL